MNMPETPKLVRKNTSEPPYKYLGFWGLHFHLNQQSVIAVNSQQLLFSIILSFF